MDEPNTTQRDDIRPAERSSQPPAATGTSGTSSSAPSSNSSASANGFDLNHPTIISLCFLASWVTGISGIVGIVLAHVWQGDAAEWERSHYTYLIRTFWFGLLGAVIGSVLLVALIGLLILPAVGIWVAVRSVLSLVKAQKREPMPDPETLLF